MGVGGGVGGMGRTLTRDFTVYRTGVSNFAPSVCSDEGQTLETSAKHHIPQAKNIPFQPLLF